MLKCGKTHIITSSSTLKCNIPTLPEGVRLCRWWPLGVPPGSLNIMQTPLKKRLEYSSGKSFFMWPHKRQKGVPRGAQNRHKPWKSEVHKGLCWNKLKMCETGSAGTIKNTVFHWRVCTFRYVHLSPQWRQKCRKPHPKMEPKSIKSCF